MSDHRIRLGVAGAVLLLAAAAQLATVPARAAEARAVLNARCAACHERLPDGSLSRVSRMRMTPEGWDMIIRRMGITHGVKVPGEERRALVKYLADSQGLAPEEAAPFRYILERRPDAIESPPDEELNVMCARCHSYARIGLQRRDAEEWLKLAHFHLGQYPTAEYQALGRDRNWWEIASTQVPKKLAELYPFTTPEWQAWKDRPHPDLSGTWRVVGHRPGAGDYQGVLEAEAKGDDRYAITMEIRYADGKSVGGRGQAVLYTGYEWRAQLKLGEERVRQVLAVDREARTLSGRWYLIGNDSLGGDLEARRVDAGAALLAVEPPYLRAGQSATLALHGVGLGGEVDLGAGVSVVRTVERGPQTVIVEARAEPGAAPGARTVRVGEAAAGGLLTVYARIDSVRVEPAYGMARVGNPEGPIAPVPAQFDAVAYLDGPDGKPGTDDDVRIGAMPASWSVADNGEAAAAMADSRFAGTMRPGGLFVPASAGPNPARRYHTNNAGDLEVRATVDDGGRAVTGKGRLIVTVQRWVDPPIR